jgi:hypothetical protein
VVGDRAAADPPAWGSVASTRGLGERQIEEPPPRPLLDHARERRRRAYASTRGGECGRHTERRRFAPILQSPRVLVRERRQRAFAPDARWQVREAQREPRRFAPILPSPHEDAARPLCTTMRAEPSSGSVVAPSSPSGQEWAHRRRRPAGVRCLSPMRRTGSLCLSGTHLQPQLPAAQRACCD